jgi:hypothetical protein
MPYIDKVNIGGVEYDIQDSNLKSAINISAPLTYSDITWKNGTVFAGSGGIGDSTTRIISDGFIFARAGSRLGLNNYT